MDTQYRRGTARAGSVLMVAAIFLAIASLAVVSILIAISSYTRINSQAYEYERAFQLADAGVRAAALDLGQGRDGVIDQARARSFFARTNELHGTWGFETTVSTVSADTRHIVSQGAYGHARAAVLADVRQRVKTQAIHPLFAHAIFAGNASHNTNYTLLIGGSGADADFVVGNVYSGENLALSGDAELRLPETFVDANGNGVYDVGEAWVDSGGVPVFTNALTPAQFSAYTGTVNRALLYANGEFDHGEAFVDTMGNGVFDPGETYSDLNSNGAYTLGEPFSDRDGIYEPGEPFMDDRNGRYDYGVEAVGTVSGMPAPGSGQQAATGNSAAIPPPDLSKMFYSLPHSATAPSNALAGWGNDVDVAAAAYDSQGTVQDSSDPSHIFVKNPDNRLYTKVPGKDDYFIEDPTDASYGDAHQFLTVHSNGNNKVYYVDGNVYLHNPNSYDLMFRMPGVRITIVAKGNITISDEFRYNGGKTNPVDSLALIATKDPAVTNSGNIYLGDAQFGTGGDIQAMLYAENDFVDNNLDTAGQPHLSVFGTMSAGNLVAINRSADPMHLRTRLDVSLDERIVNGVNLPPGLPQALAGQRSIAVTGAWEVVKGTWYTHSPLN